MRRLLLEIPLPFTSKVLPVYSYGAMLMLGFLAGLFLAKRRARRVGTDPNLIIDLALVTLLSGVLGARLFYIVELWQVYLKESGGFFKIFKIWEGGLVFYGGFICATAGVVVFARIKKLPVPLLLDVLAPSAMLGLAFGRVGCFLNGCCYGKPTGLFCAVRFPPGSPIYTPPNALPPGTYVHPTQLYSSLGALLIYAILEVYFRRNPRPGRVAHLLCVLYPIHRFLIEFLRADTLQPLKWPATNNYDELPAEAYLTQQDLVWKGLSTSQKTSLAVFLVAVALWVAGRFLPRTPPRGPSRSERRAAERHRKKRKPPDAGQGKNSAKP